MKRFLSVIAAIACCVSLYAGKLCRNYWGCEMGKATPKECVDTIKAQFAKEQLQPKIEGEFVIVPQIWLYGLQFDEAKLQFKQDRLKSITLTKKFFTLDNADLFLKEVAPYFVGENTEPNNAGLLSKKDNATIVRLAQSELSDGNAKVEIAVIDIE